MQNSGSLLHRYPTGKGSLCTARAFGVRLSLIALACWGSTSALADCREGCSGDNTFLGEDALLFNDGTLNTGVGYFALRKNVFGTWSTAVGGFTLLNNLSSQNTAIGTFAMQDNKSGQLNTAVGAWAMRFNTTADSNTAMGWSALELNTTGATNTATGFQALLGNSTGSNNVGIGYDTLPYNTSSNDNTAVGTKALFNATGGNNIGFGSSGGSELTTGDDNIDIGNVGVAGDSGIMRIGTAGTQTATFIAGVVDAPIGSARSVGVTADGQLGVKVSSARYKEGIQPMDKSSEALLELKPVTFRYKKELDPKGARQFGLVAEEVAKADPDLVELDAKGKPFTVRYDEVNAMLLNEFLKEQHELKIEDETLTKRRKKMAELKSTIQELKSAFDAQAAQLRHLKARNTVTQASTQLLPNSVTPLQVASGRSP